MANIVGLATDSLTGDRGRGDCHRRNGGQKLLRAIQHSLSKSVSEVVLYAGLSPDNDLISDRMPRYSLSGCERMRDFKKIEEFAARERNRSLFAV